MAYTQQSHSQSHNLGPSETSPEPTSSASTDAQDLMGNQAWLEDLRLSRGETHVVEPGESLWSIAEAELGNGSRWPEIYAENQAVVGGDPDSISPGQELVMPGGPSMTDGESQVVPTGASDGEGTDLESRVQEAIESGVPEDIAECVVQNDDAAATDSATLEDLRGIAEDKITDKIIQQVVKLVSPKSFLGPFKVIFGVFDDPKPAGDAWDECWAETEEDGNP